jgi:hypothetical protein
MPGMGSPFSASLSLYKALRLSAHPTWREDRRVAPLSPAQPHPLAVRAAHNGLYECDMCITGSNPLRQECDGAPRTVSCAALRQAYDSTYMMPHGVLRLRRRLGVLLATSLFFSFFFLLTSKSNNNNNWGRMRHHATGPTSHGVYN